MTTDTTACDAQPWQQAYPDAGIAAALPPPRHRNLAHLVHSACEKYAARKAFTTFSPNGMNGSLTSAQVGALSDAFATYLRQICGLQAGDRVAGQLPNGLAYPVVAFGVFKAGCVLVNTNPLYTPSETIHQLNDSGAQVLVIVDMFADKLAEVVPKTGLRRVVLAGVSELFPAVPNLVVRGVQRAWSKVLPAVPPLAVPVDRFSQAIHQGHKGTHAHADTSASASADADAATVQSWWFDQPASRIAAQQYTGGTTGVSKGAMLTHANLLANIDQVLAMGKPTWAATNAC